MIRILLIGTVIIFILGGLGYWRFIASKNNNLATTKNEETLSNDSLAGPKEVPNGLPSSIDSTDEDKIKGLQTSLDNLTLELNKLKQNNSSDARLRVLETSITDLSVRMAALEKGTSTASPVPSSNKQSTVYIPLGSGGQAGNTDWFSVANYQITLDPSQFPGYSNMQLEVNFRLTQKSGTGYARLYNATDNTALQQVSTTSDVLSTQTTYYFNLASGSKSYVLQIKSSEGVNLDIQSARIKVNF